VLPRNEIERHQQNDCRQQQISCIYFDIGCHVKIARCLIAKHDNEFNPTHTRLLFNHLTVTRNELPATKNDPTFTQNELIAKRDELSSTTGWNHPQLGSTRTELRETNDKLEKATNELVDLKKSLSTHAPTHQAVSTTTPPAAKPRSNPTATPPKVEEIIPSLMIKVVRPSQPQTAQSSYCANVKRMSELMMNGQLYYLNEDECFFKLKLKQNHQSLYIYLVEDITGYRNNSYNVFEFLNEDIVLWICSSYYRLYVSIRKHDQKNSKCFLIDTKQSGNNLLMGYGGENVGWNDYKDANDCVLFYFTKK